MPVKIWEGGSGGNGLVGVGQVYLWSLLHKMFCKSLVDIPHLNSDSFRFSLGNSRLFVNGIVIAKLPGPPQNLVIFLKVEPYSR